MADPRWLTDHEQATWRAFLQASQQLQAQLDRALEQDAGMPLAYYQVLAMLSEAPERTLRMSDLAAQTWSSRSRLSHAVDRLEERGWVERLSCPSDKRGAYARLTKAGYAVLVEAAPKHVASVRQYFFDLLTPEHIDQLGAIFARIADEQSAELPRDA